MQRVLMLMKAVFAQRSSFLTKPPFCLKERKNNSALKMNRMNLRSVIMVYVSRIHQWDGKMITAKPLKLSLAGQEHQARSSMKVAVLISKMPTKNSDLIPQLLNSETISFGFKRLYQWLLIICNYEILIRVT